MSQVMLPTPAGHQSGYGRGMVPVGAPTAQSRGAVTPPRAYLNADIRGRTPPRSATPRSAAADGAAAQALGAAAQGASTLPRAGGGGTTPSAYAAQGASPMFGAADQQSDAAADAGGAKGSVWREGLAVEVYSKSAGQWSPGIIELISGDMIKVRYFTCGQWCEKVLLQNSDSLRVADQQAQPSRGSAAVADSDAPAAAAAPAPLGVRTPPSAPAQPLETFGAVSSQPGRDGTAGSNHTPRQVAREASTPSLSSAAAAHVDRAQGLPAAAARAATPTGHGKASTPRQTARSSTPPPGTAPQEVQRQWVAEGTPPDASSKAPQVVGTKDVGSVFLNVTDLQYDKVLGSGGFGSVYRGTYCGQEVAIKKMHPPQDGAITPAQLTEFQKEVENLQALRHPRLVAFIGVAVSPPTLCIVTEFMPNGSLHALLHERKQAMSQTTRLCIAAHVAEGIAFLHSRTPPFVHRDVKSLNVVLDYQLNAKLCDFGLTQSMEKTHISRRDNEFGSPRYMAPELFHAKGKVTEKIDVWALGCLIMECCTSRNPHEDCDTVEQVMKKTLIERQWPYTDFRGEGEKLRVLAELCFEFHPSYRVGAVRILQELKRTCGA